MMTIEMLCECEQVSQINVEKQVVLQNVQTLANDVKKTGLEYNQQITSYFEIKSIK